jgi:hypothetical protein
VLLARAVLVSLLLLAPLASAQASSDARLPKLRASLVGGASARHLEFFAATLPDEGGTVVRGVSPTSLALNAAWFPLDTLGVEVDGNFSAFVACPENDCRDSARNVPLRGFSFAGGPVGRWAPVPWLRLEASLGYGALREPLMRQGQEGGGGFIGHGPTAKLGVGVAAGAFEAMLWGRGGFSLGGGIGELLLAPLGLLSWEAGLRAGWAVLDLDTLRVVPLVRVAARGAGARVRASPDPVLEASALVVDFAAGVEVSLVPPRPPPPPLIPPTAFLVRVRLPDGRPAADAIVRIDGTEAGRTDATGELRAEVKGGAHEVTASLKGFTDASASGSANDGETTPLELALTPLTGPGTIVGRVQTEDEKAVPNVTVAGPAGVKVTTDDAGAFTLPKVGPGIVALQLTAPGFVKKEELVQVPPGGQASVTVTLVPSTEPLKAVLRGSIRSTTGRPVTAAVRIANSKVKVKVGADGRFEVQLDAGTYSLTISAPGHMPQTKSVTLAPGDQAIFQVDLQPGR